MPKISVETLNQLFSSGGKLYPLYEETVKLYNSLKVHAEGICPIDLINKRRPSESDEILQYRKDTYEPVTKLPISKAIHCYSKIRRSADWMIDFPKDVPARITPDETLEKYCTESLPVFTSITNWAFDILLPQNLIDANAVIAVIPQEMITADNFSKPIPILFNSDQVMYYSEKDKYAVLKSRVKVSYLDQDGFKTGDRFYYIDDKEIQIYEMGKGGYSIVFQQSNTIGRFPVFKVKSETYKQYDNMSVSRSRMHAMVPFLNKAAAGDSDLEASKIQHLYPLMWYYQSKECNSCNGFGKKATETGEVACSSCNGSGKVKFSPFVHLEIDLPGIDKQSAPTPPAGYINRDTAILELQEKNVDKNLYQALAALNMQFLDQTPLSISGDAKQVDREELNNTVYNTAEDLVCSVEKVIDLINEWRNSFMVSDEKQRRAMLPKIPVPQNYDLLPEDYLMDEVSKARTAKVNPLLVATLEQQLAAKKFYNQPDLASNIKLLFDLDPLPGLSVDEKMSLISNKAITQEDFVISSYMAAFIKRALREDKDFHARDYSKQMELLSKYAGEKIKSNDASSEMQDNQRQAIIAEMKSQDGNTATA